MLFSLLESIRSAMQSIRAHGFRSFLTTLGIIIGVASVIAVVSIIQGLSYSIGKSFEGLGSNSLSIQAVTPLEDRLQGKFARLTDEDVNLINYRVDGLEFVSPRILGTVNSTVRYEGKTASTQIWGVTSNYQDLAQQFAEYGRFISESDNASRRRVCVIGSEVKEELDLPDNPVGEFISLGGEWFKIVGLLETRGKFFGISQDNFVYLPFNTQRSVIGNQFSPYMDIQLTVKDVAELEKVKAQITSVLRKGHRLEPGDPDDFRIQTAEQLTDSFNQIIGSITAVSAGIVGISLLVGGIGIMNIMLVSVTERTREIGICKAVGAKRYHILLQFLIEAVILSMLGGAIGIAIGYGIGLLVSSVLPGFPPAAVPLWAILLSFGFSALVGIIFGILPASKAANLDPIDALRFE